MPQTPNSVTFQGTNSSSAPRTTVSGSEGVARPRRGWIIPALLSLLFVVQCVWFINTQSLSNDEPLHIINGLEAWRLHRFERWNDHPPLDFLIGTIPLLAIQGNIDIQPEARLASAIYPSPASVAWGARTFNVLLGVILGLLLWTTARRFFSEGAANFVLALYALSPSLIANFSISCNDGALALAAFGAALSLAHWRKQPTWGRGVALGIVLGAMLSTKFSTPLLFVLALGLVLILKPDSVTFRPRDWNWRQSFAILGVSLLVVWSVYFFHVTKVRIENSYLTVTSPNRSEPLEGSAHRHVPINLTLYLPAGEYLEGMGRVAGHLKRGHPCFFFGQIKTNGGWKAYFPVVVLLKWPIVVLVLFLATLVFAALKRVSIPQELLLLSVFPVIYFAAAIFSKVDLGERHILLVYPFALLWIGALWQFARQRRAILFLFLALTVVQAGDILRYAPDYLSYFTPFVKPATSYKLLSDSNVDWGQGLIALRKYQQQHPDETIHLAYFGTIDPKLYGIHYTPLPPSEHVTGTVVISANYLSGQLVENNPTGYHWLYQYRETDMLNHSLHVFKVPPQAQ
jgi:hypothetical protein